MAYRRTSTGRLPEFATAYRAGSETWSTQPAGQTEYLGATSRRLRVNLQGRTEVRISRSMSTAGFTGATVQFDYTTDLTGASGWTQLSPTVTIDATGYLAGAWGTIPTAALDASEVLIRISGTGGNATVSPVFVAIWLHLR